MHARDHDTCERYKVLTVLAICTCTSCSGLLSNVGVEYLLHAAVWPSPMSLTRSPHSLQCTPIVLSLTACMVKIQPKV